MLRLQFPVTTETFSGPFFLTAICERAKNTGKIKLERLLLITHAICCEDPVQVVLAGSQVASGTHAGILLGPSDIGCQYSW